ncbi:AraC family transcriptional regulator [Paenibacillus sp.]|uniref:AraC family transcriptional regulator n=1 Tax=Paenibacillus sp. TaxID=58172 RepID=UPI002812136D|nr:AraC family transcriptional regulator [Paenibacillus sp.]
MNTMEHLNDAMRYIEERLTSEIDFKEVARRAYCSEYHFKRMFSFLAGVPLSEYIRRRRLTLAAFELQYSRDRILDIALKYGYDSPDAFARAFQQFHGVTPSEARSHGRSLKSFPRMSFQLTIQGGAEMKYRIEAKEPFRLVGIKKRVPIVFHGVNPEIAEMAASLDEAKIARLKELSDTTPSGIISGSANFSEGRMEERGELDHYIGVATTKACPEEFEALDVPASTWAVFESVGPFPETLQGIWGRIYSEWFPSSSYELAPGPEMLRHESKDFASPAFRSEIWIPVTKKTTI